MSRLTPREREGLHRLAEAHDVERAAFKAHKESERAFTALVSQYPNLPHTLIHTLIHSNPLPSVVRNGRVYTFQPASASKNGLSITVTDLIEAPESES